MQQTAQLPLKYGAVRALAEVKRMGSERVHADRRLSQLSLSGTAGSCQRKRLRKEGAAPRDQEQPLDCMIMSTESTAAAPVTLDTYDADTSKANLTQACYNGCLPCNAAACDS